MIHRFITALREADVDPDWRDVADVLWLADVRARSVTREQRDRTPAGEPEADQPLTPESEIPEPAADGGRPPAGSHEEPRTDEEPAAPQRITPSMPRMPAGLHLAERAGPDAAGAAGLDTVVPARYALPGGQQIGRALRPLKQHR